MKRKALPKKYTLEIRRYVLRLFMESVLTFGKRMFPQTLTRAQHPRNSTVRISQALRDDLKNRNLKEQRAAAAEREYVYVSQFTHYPSQSFPRFRIKNERAPRLTRNQGYLINWNGSLSISLRGRFFSQKYEYIL